ncbi:MAG: hypothetical protein JWO00_433 [Candidatus Parcubacteria bacterium]|nr:hypothetical protein [Candidatus Parcubacteria bacterium]
MLIGLLLVGTLFLALRLPGIHLPYHQDEWKNISASASVATAGQFFAHPPFMQMLFVAGHEFFGADYFRAFPLLFSIGAGFLLFAVVKRRAGEAAAWWSALLFTVCFYNIFGSLQADVDGAILPFVFLLAVYFYDRYVAAAEAASRRKWLGILIAVSLAGLLIKLSFILVIGALLLDYLWTYRRDMLAKRTAMAAGGSIGFGAVYIAALYLIHAVYPAFDINFMIGHANQFAGANGRNWTQIFVQAVKAVYYLSPLLIVPLVFISKDIVRRTRPFILYIALGFVFYFVLFDFSQGALDKYLMFSIVPLAALAGIVIAEIFKGLRFPESRENDGEPRTFPVVAIITGLVIAVTLVSLNFLPQTVAALYPKTEWFSKVLHGHWNVLTPLTGGSGPLGFYISFLFIAVSFIVSIALAAAAMAKKQWRVPFMVAIVIIGLTYNTVFSEELLLGKLNGSSADVMHRTVAFISKTPSVTPVLSYNDIGSHELSVIGKYGGRFYATPDFEEGHKKKFADYRYYMVIDIPHLYEDGFYGRFFATCTPLFNAFSGRITGRVYDCPATTTQATAAATVPAAK